MATYSPWVKSQLEPRGCFPQIPAKEAWHSLALKQFHTGIHISFFQIQWYLTTKKPKKYIGPGPNIVLTGKVTKLQSKQNSRKKKQP